MHIIPTHERYQQNPFYKRKNKKGEREKPNLYIFIRLLSILFIYYLFFLFEINGIYYYIK
jgi:hypothetical protein